MNALRRGIAGTLALLLLAATTAWAEPKIGMSADPVHSNWLRLRTPTLGQAYLAPWSGGLGADASTASGIPVFNGAGGLSFYSADKPLQFPIYDPATDVTVADGIASFQFPWACTLVGVHAEVDTAGSAGLVTVQFRNQAGLDMLSTPCTIDAGETGSHTAAPPAVINPALAALTQWDNIKVDVKATSTGAKGLKVFFIVRP